MNSLASFTDVLHRLRPQFHDPRARDFTVIEKIRDAADEHQKLSDAQLGEAVQKLKAAESTTDDARIAQAFVLVNEAARRTLGINYYDVQLLSGLALARGAIAEMQTGEGKTFVAALPAFLFALAGRGVHVMTVNAYLAERDCDLLAPLYRLLGMSLGFLQPQADADQKRQTYACDIVYGPGYEFGFDYLRDQVALLNRRQERRGDRYRQLLHGHEADVYEPIQRPLAFAIIDEIDSVLIDEASSPLILSEGSGDATGDSPLYNHARNVARELKPDEDYIVEEAKRQIRLTGLGLARASGGLESLPAPSLERPWTTYVEQAMRAKELFRRDVDYIVDDDKVVLVDQMTGRLFRDRSLRDGLHQAIEAKEEVTITAEQRPLARIPRQRYVRRYEVICGMTGTASGSEREFWEFYQLRVVQIPLRKETRRVTHPPRFFTCQQAKWDAIVADIKRIHQLRQPILTGTRTIKDSELVARALDQVGIPYRLLNGVQDADEATIVAAAGTAGAVTIATNMAGRGTDIKLGEGVAELGGIHVIATEPHESPRVDRQLMGRCARQGDPGSCQLFVSAEDQLIVEHGPALARRMQRLGNQAGEIEADLASDVLKIQQAAERQNYVRRRRLFAHEVWLNSVLSTLAKQS